METPAETGPRPAWTCLCFQPQRRRQEDAAESRCAFHELYGLSCLEFVYEVWSLLPTAVRKWGARGCVICVH